APSLIANLTPIFDFLKNKFFRYEGIDESGVKILSAILNADIPVEILANFYEFWSRIKDFNPKVKILEPKINLILEN
ncbi:MAG: hypothetical protein ACTSWY_05545, partial [Promethearchaeota archaeon]